MWQPRMNKLPGDRLHLSHGPIDVVLKAWGTPEAVRAATRAAARGFPRVLPMLMEEIKELKKAKNADFGAVFEHLVDPDDAHVARKEAEYID